MSGPAVSQVHHGGFPALTDTVDIGALFRIIGRCGVRSELDRPLASIRQDLIKMIICVIYHAGRRSRKILMRPGICQHVHGKPCCFEIFSLHLIDGLHQKISIGLAYQMISLHIPFSAALSLRIEVSGQKMEGSPDPRHILLGYGIASGIRHFHGKHGGSRLHGRAYAAQDRLGAKVYKKRTSGNTKRLFMCITRQNSGGIGSVIMKILVHDAPSSASFSLRFRLLTFAPATRSWMVMTREVTSIMIGTIWSKKLPRLFTPSENSNTR